MITLEANRLVFRFPEVHEEAILAVEFLRTLRIPDDGRKWPLPPGLGRFPLRHLEDYEPKLPEAWRRRGGVILPMYRAEALWLHFRTAGERAFPRTGYPFAIKIAAGRINAVTGEPWTDSLNRDPQDYLVAPDQPWLDGFCVEKGVVRQFVAMPAGEGWSVEEQITGEAEWGGIQILVHPMKREHYVALRRPEPFPTMACACPADMGLAAGGRMRQEIYEDPHPFDAWDLRHRARCFVTLVEAGHWFALTGELPPTPPPSAKDYAEAGLPWFDWYDADRRALEGAARLAGLESLGELAKAKGEAFEEEDLDPESLWTVPLGPARRGRSRRVREPEAL